MTVADAIAALLADPADVTLAQSIFGTTDAAEIAARVTAFVEKELGTPVVDCPLFTQSVGAVFGLVLGDGARVALKVHAFGAQLRGFTDLGEVWAAYAAQDAFVAAGLPCAPVVRPPARFHGGAAAILGWLDPGPGDDPHAPATRRALAELLARTLEVGKALPATIADRLPRSPLPVTLFPAPHNALFDLSAPGGEWIDERAARAKLALDRDELRVMHTDISCANVRVVGGRVAAVYDGDSIGWIDEVRCVASVAVHFTYTGDTWTWPSRDEAAAFVADYEAARGTPFTADEHRRLAAAMIYAIAYTARCEHALGGPTPMADLLR